MSETRTGWAKENAIQREAFAESNRALKEQLDRNTEKFQYEQNKVEAESLDSFNVSKKRRLRRYHQCTRR